MFQENFRFQTSFKRFLQMVLIKKITNKQKFSITTGRIIILILLYPSLIFITFQVSIHGSTSITTQIHFGSALTIDSNFMLLCLVPLRVGLLISVFCFFSLCLLRGRVSLWNVFSCRVSFSFVLLGRPAPLFCKVCCPGPFQPMEHVFCFGTWDESFFSWDSTMLSKCNCFFP